MARQAFSFVRDLEPAPAQPFCVDRHYLLYAARGVLRFEVDGTNWFQGFIWQRLLVT